MLSINQIEFQPNVSFKGGFFGRFSVCLPKKQILPHFSIVVHYSLELGLSILSQSTKFFREH